MENVEFPISWTTGDPNGDRCSCGKLIAEPSAGCRAWHGDRMVSITPPEPVVSSIFWTNEDDEVELNRCLCGKLLVEPSEGCGRNEHPVDIQSYPVEGNTNESQDIYNPPAFEDQNFGPPNFILLSRIYDLLAVIATKIDPTQADYVIDEHEAGRIVSDPPFLDFGEDDGNS